MKFKVFATPAAQAQIRKLGACRRANREKNPTAFSEGMRRVRLLLSEQPYVGTPVSEPDIVGLRSYPIRPTPYLVFYVPDAAKQIVMIEAVHSSIVQGGPKIRPQ